MKAHESSARFRAQGLKPRPIPGLPSNAPGHGTNGAAVQAASVCVLGNFSDANGAKKGLWPHADGVKEHWITVTGTTSDGNYIVNDPANPDRAPVEVTPQQLQSFIGDKGTAVSVQAP